MPWNDKSNPGPWGSPPGESGGGSGDGGGDKPKGGSPWTRPPQPPRQPPPRPPGGGGGGGGGPRDPRGGPSFKGPDVDQLLAALRERLNRFFRGPGGRRVRPEAVGAVVAGMAALWLLTGVYVVQPNEQAVVTRFGAYAGTAMPGLQYRAPWPIEAAEKVPVTSVQRTDVGGQDTSAAGAGDSQMLTGDENIVDLDFTVQWRVSNAAQYLFALENPDQTVRAVAESAMREVVGRTALDPIISTGRGRVQTDVAVLMQRVLDAYGAGVEVVEVQIRNAGPPADVVPAFRAVASAGQEAESRVNEATAFRNRVVAEAAGDAAQRRRAAEGYREQAIREAEGAAARFDQIYTQYASAPDVTRRRLYLETMERVIRESRTVVLDSRGGAAAPIILPPSTPGAPAAAAAATPAPAQPQASAR